MLTEWIAIPSVLLKALVIKTYLRVLSVYIVSVYFSTNQGYRNSCNAQAMLKSTS